MGMCQSYFGASTSGQGLTASQLAACIRAAAHARTEDSPATNTNAAGGSEAAAAAPTAAPAATAEAAAAAAAQNQNTPPEGPSDAQQQQQPSSTKQQEDESNKDNTLFTSTYTVTVESEGSTLEVTSFAPQAFAAIRAMEGISDKFFESEWKLPEDHLGLRETEGRSRAMFLVSNHRCLLCKTVSQGEVDVLLGMLPSLMKHLKEHPESLLQRFVLALRIVDAATKETGWVCVFTDIFAKSPVIHEKWDLKGRKPKCGKYLFMPPGDLSTLLEEANGTEEEANDGDGAASDSKANKYKVPASASKNSDDDATKKKNGEQQKSETTAATKSVLSSNADRSNPNVVADVLDEDTDRPVTKVYGDGYNRVIARKDKELTRVFWLPKDVHTDLQKTIQLDANFLGAAGILDYSLLIGVKYADPSSPYKALRFNELYHPIANPDEIPAERRDTCGGVEFDSSSKYHRGIVSSASLEVYYIGIIDMLTAYTVPKKAANFFKNCLWTDATLSTVPPEMYKERCVDFMSKCIVVGPES